ncbi:hypothetical protein QU41_14095 [Bradyrhizobium elkanii]|nr:hypothetical protein QU41_14095 [Bradyrhizobium elkanii]
MVQHPFGCAAAALVVAACGKAAVIRGFPAAFAFLAFLALTCLLALTGFFALPAFRALAFFIRPPSRCDRCNDRFPHSARTRGKLQYVLLQL